MLLYKFMSRGGHRVALSKDNAGANLPPDGAPWKLIGTANIEKGGGPLIGASSDEVIEAIETDGVVIWPFQREKPKSAA